jgi:hypothetical protein
MLLSSAAWCVVGLCLIAGCWWAEPASHVVLLLPVFDRVAIVSVEDTFCLNGRGGEDVVVYWLFT